MSQKAPEIRISVRGRFSVKAADGTDLTPPFRKERALVALLAMAPDRRQTRAWLQAMLWSEKSPEKAATSLRRALSNLKKHLGDHAAMLDSNRLEIWLADAVAVDREASSPQAELLEMVEAPDPAFDDWLRDLRAADTGPSMPEPRTFQELVGPATKAQGGTVVVLTTRDRATGATSEFLDAMLIDTLATRLEAEGADEIYADVTPDPGRLERASAIIHLDLVSAHDGDWWNVHLRALADQERRFLWSGRLRLRRDLRQLALGAEMQAFASKALSQVFLRYGSFRRIDRSPLVAMQRAIARLYVTDLEQIHRAERELEALSGGEGASVALAWRAFARLAEGMEFGQVTPGLAEEAEALSDEALQLRPGNPLVSALSARVALDVKGDLDRAEFLSRLAVQGDDGNPYALQAKSRVALIKGQAEEAHEAAKAARQASEGLPHSFAWDMEVCLTALGTGDLKGALEAAKSAHGNNKPYRAALRYLVALSLLNGDDALAAYAIQQLRQYEPDFDPSHLRREDYPVLTLRNTGYAQDLP